MSLKKEISDLLSGIADLLEFKGDNPFKINAYRNGANVIRAIEGDIEPLIEDGTIKNIKGIGKGILAVILEYKSTGVCEEYEQLLGEMPPGIFDLMRIRGLGAKKIKVLFDELGIGTIEELENACRSNSLSSVKGFGEKTQEKIISEIDRIKSTRFMCLLSEADIEVNELLYRLRAVPGIKEIEVSGEYRRSLEVLTRLDFVAFVENYELAEKDILNIGLILQDAPAEQLGKLNIDSKSIRLKTDGMLPAYLHLTSNLKDFAFLQFMITGSSGFVEKVYKDDIRAAQNEKEIFTRLSMEYVIPEMREDEYFLLNNKQNSDLDFSLFQGFMHFHTTYSDGKSSLKEMVTAAADRGFKYFAVCDHSKSAFYANGLKETILFKQSREIEKVKAETGLTIFHGIESDILNDGSLDYDDEILNGLHLVVASVHSRFNQSQEEMTRRIIKAVENPYTDILGHPTGRLLLERKPFQVDIKKVIDACAANKVAIEINAHPLRLDLDWRYIWYAREKGCLFAINPDAHSVQEISLIDYGIRIARKGGLSSSEVINCFTVDKYKEFLNRKLNKTGNHF